MSFPTTHLEGEMSDQLLSANKHTPPPTVLVFGETGVGKSSVINMLAGKEIAQTSGDAKGETFGNIHYPVSVFISDTKTTKEIIVWDTAGLNEGEHGTVSPEKALENLRHLVENLGSGLNLLVYVVRAWRLGEVLNLNYDIFVTGICQGKVPVVLVVTGCENESPMEDWWTQNKEELDSHNLRFQDHACITSSRGKLKGGVHMLEEEYQVSEEAVRHVVVDNLMAVPWIEDKRRWMQTMKGWFINKRMFNQTESPASARKQLAGQKTNSNEEKRDMGGPKFKVKLSFGRLGTFTWEAPESQ